MWSDEVFKVNEVKNVSKDGSLRWFTVEDLRNDPCFLVCRGHESGE